MHLPELEHPRLTCADFSFNEKVVFALGGTNENVTYHSVDELYVLTPTFWTQTGLSASEEFADKVEMCAIQISSEEVLLFGGFYNLKNKNKDAKVSYILTISAEGIKWKAAPDLVNEGAFYYSSAPVYDVKCVYGVDYAKNIHIYSLPQQKWAVVASK